MTITIDDIAGTYSTATPGFTVNFTQIVVLPPDPNNPSKFTKLALLTDVEGNEKTVEIDMYFHEDTATTNFGAGFTMPSGQVLSFAMKLIFRQEDGNWTFDGTIQDQLNKKLGPVMTMLGINKELSVVNQNNLDEVKNLFPDNEEVQGIQLSDLLNYMRKIPLDGSAVRAAADSKPIKPGSVASCVWSIGDVVIDCILLFSSTVGMKNKVKNSGKVRYALEDFLKRTKNTSQIRTAIEAVKAAVGAKAKVMAMWGVISTLNAIGLLKKIIGIIVAGLSPLDLLAFGVLILGTLYAAPLTGGLVLFGEVLVMSAMIGTLLLDVDHMIENCKTATSDGDGKGNGKG